MALIARVEREPAHPRSGRLLATAALALRPSDLDVNQDRFVLCSAHFALATIVRSGGIERQSALRELRVIAEHGLGKTAPKTEGVDLDGNAISLSDYRGRVVLLSFWATWYGPCLRAIPHERELVERFDSKNFAILGMNADDDADEANAAVKKHEVS
ncbi:TlpA family protein disulfide reductase [Roseimaritima ulvae]|nr:TlpA disulfide reductase family protein [Roseimaritima ulvae]